METLSYCQLMERYLAAEARVAEMESRADAGPVGFRWRWVDAGEGPGEWWYHDMQHFDVVSRDKNRECQLIYTQPQPAPVVPDDISGPLAHAYKELTPTFMRNHIGVFERYGIYPDGTAGIQAMRIALDGITRRAAMLQGIK